MGHLGLTPQSVNKFGGYGVRAKGDAEAEKLVADAHLLADAGCFSLVLEKVPQALAERVAKEINIPVIGIGAGPGCDGQVLVLHDMLGMNQGFRPSSPAATPTSRPPSTMPWANTWPMSRPSPSPNTRRSILILNFECRILNVEMRRTAKRPIQHSKFDYSKFLFPEKKCIFAKNKSLRAVYLM